MAELWKSLPKEVAAGAVALASLYLMLRVCLLFLATFEKWGKSRDEERQQALAERNAQQAAFLGTMERRDTQAAQALEGFLGATTLLVGLATTMVHHCQRNLPAHERITVEQVQGAAADLVRAYREGGRGT